MGVFPITITTYTTTISACGAEQDIDFDLQVSDPPTADFSWVTSGCVAEPFQFSETTPQTPKPTYSFWWNLATRRGANNISSLETRHTLSLRGHLSVRFADITKPGA